MKRSTRLMFFGFQINLVGFFLIYVWVIGHSNSPELAGIQLVGMAMLLLGLILSGFSAFGRE